MNLPDNFPYGEDLIDRIVPVLGGVYDHVHMQEAQKVEEVVGLVVEGYHIRLVNQARSHARFDIGPSQFDDVVRDIPSDRALLAFYHSHPTGNLAPSIEDQSMMMLQFAQGVYMPWLIVTVTPYPRSRLHWLDPQYQVIASYDLPVTVSA